MLIRMANRAKLNVEDNPCPWKVDGNMKLTAKQAEKHIQTLEFCIYVLSALLDADRVRAVYEQNPMVVARAVGTAVLVVGRFGDLANPRNKPDTVEVVDKH